ncbi:MAG: contractile injection system tape measure protein [Paludibacteraceae bacterium]|nr:contractile injection system tape measure protein [Paludibacteraceae bacterium]
MPDVHKINRIVYEVNFNSEQLAYNFQAGVNTFMQSNLVPVIDEVLNSFDIKNQVVSIDTLELDLGRVDYENSEAEIKDRLRDELTKILREKLAEIKQASTENERIISNEKSDYRHLLFFLEKGYLPWNSSYNSFQSVEKILAQALTHNRETFVQWLKGLGKNANIRLRIINQFNDPQINEIVKAVDPVNATFIIGYSADLRQIHKKEPIVPFTETGFRETTWAIILSYLLTDRGSRFNKKSFVAHTIQQLAISQNIDYGALLQVLNRSVSKMLDTMAFKTEFPSIISELATEYHGADNKKEENQHREEQEKAQAITMLQQFLNGDEKRLDFQRLKKLAKEYPAELIALLLHHLAHEASRKTMVELLSEEQVKWIIQVLEPLQCEFIFQFAEKLDRGYEHHQIDSSQQNFKKVKWHIILTTLHEERGSQFNRKAFIKSSILRLAAQYNIPYAELVQHLQSAIEATSSPLGILNEVLDELTEEGHVENQKRLQPHDSISHYFEAQDLYELLLFYMENGFTAANVYAKFGVYSVSELLLKLNTLSPELTRHFLIQVKEPARQKQLLENGSDDFILLVIRLILLTENNAGHEDATEFIRALKEHVLSVINVSEYYAVVLKLITEHHQIDFTKIISDINRSWNERIQFTPHHPIPYSTIKQHLISLLKNKPGSLMCNLSYPETWEYLSAHYQNNSSSILQHLANEPRLWELFIKNTPDSLLLTILKNSNLLDFTFRVIHHFSASYGLQVQQQSFKQRAFFWQIVIETIFNPAITNTDTQITVLLTNIVSGINSKKLQEKAIKDFLTGLAVFSTSERQKLEAIILSVQKNLSISAEVENKAKAKKLETQALLLLEESSINDWNTPMLETLIRLMKEKPIVVTEILLRNIQNSKTRQYWIKNLPESILKRIFFLLFPNDFIRTQSTLDILWNAYQHSIHKLGISIRVTNKWQFMFDVLANTLPCSSSKNLARSFIRSLLSSISPYNEMVFMDALCKELDSNQQPIQKELYVTLINQIKMLEKELKEKEPNREKALPEDKQQPETAKEEEPGETIYIRNAGLVLAAPYLPELFKRFELTENGAFKNRETAERAIHLLQYMVNEQTVLPEFMLLLNKILCGIPTGIPIIRSIEISPKEAETIQQLLEAMIQNWKVIGNTSIKGFQESFLQREGSLQLRDGQWHLQVESRAYDMLLDQLPWSYTTIKYPWMNNVIYVQWR